MGINQPISGSGGGGGGGGDIALLLESGLAGAKATALTEMTDPALTDLGYAVDDPSGAPLSRNVEWGRILALLGLDVVQGRLTLTSGTPVTTSDVAAATTLYFTPFNGNRIALYDGTSWDLYSFTERSIAIPATTDTNYDVFIYDNAGALTLSLTAWTNDTTRATALTTQDGVYVKNGATDYRYLGTIRTTDASGETEDSDSRRFVWNCYNRVSRYMEVIDATGSWNYATIAWRPANNDSANIVEFVQGLVENPVVASTNVRIKTGYDSDAGQTGIGLDATNANSAQFKNDILHDLAGCTGTIVSIISAHYTGYPSIGYHYLAWLEYVRAGTVTYFGETYGLMAMIDA